MDQIKADVLNITTNSSEFVSSVLFTAPTGETATIICRTNKHHLSVDADGAPVNSRNASVSFSEFAFEGTGYPIRGLSGRVNLDKHKVTWTDSTGQPSTYMIKEWFPDETLGLIVCILSDFK